jgi:predicted  nucleic acid-binding Zn-ribbon protein
MSGQGSEELLVLNRKLDDLIGRFNTLRNEVVDLKVINGSLQDLLNERDLRITELETKYDRIKLSGALLGEGENAQEAKRKIGELVREIDKCVALLNR